MKENLKIRFNDFERQEVINLLRSIGKTLHDGAEKNWHEISIIYIYAKYDKLEWDTDSGDTFSIDDAKEITLPELRELARPKEYLNGKFELVVTNQPDDGFILVPDGSEYFVKGHGSEALFFYKHDGEYMAWKMPQGKNWIPSSHTSPTTAFIILWQRENKVEAVKGRFLHQWAYEAFGRGEDVQIGGAHAFEYFDLNFQHSLSDFNNPAYRFRLKPQTITIGSRTINRPISVKPEIGKVVYMPHLTGAKKVVSMIWEDSHLDYGILSKNLCHITEQDAINHTDALLELMK